MQSRNTAKSNLLYQTIDSLPVFEARVAKEDRSLMNAVFFLKDQSLEDPFLSLCKAEGMVGVKGYRTVGGVRVSMYNAMPLSSVQLFCDLMKHFASKHG
jgi:phosphoserine aminotransferase